MEEKKLPSLYVQASQLCMQRLGFAGTIPAGLK